LPQPVAEAASSMAVNPTVTVDLLKNSIGLKSPPFDSVGAGAERSLEAGEGTTPPSAKANRMNLGRG
jgi:hypothetical protein